MRTTMLRAAVVLALGSGAAQAQSMRPTYSYPPMPEGAGPASIQLGASPFYLAPYLGFAAGHDDNVLLTRDNTRSSALYIVSPGLKLDARSAQTVFQASYQGQFGRYTNSSSDNFSNHVAAAQFDAAFDRRNFLRLNLDLVRSAEPRGSTDRPVSNEPDKYRAVTPGFVYAFGAPDARGRAEVYASESRKRYLNNRATTALGDRDTRSGGGALYLRVAPKTYAVAEARATRIRYIQPSQNSADERRFYGGLAWNATATTTGVFKVGRMERSFDSQVPDYSGVSWEAAVTWAPRTYSKLTFYTERQTAEATGLGNFIVTTASGVSWGHAWSTVWNTAVDVRHQKDEYQGFNRKDDTMSLGFKVGYKFRRWLTLGAEYNHINRDSNLDSSEYDKNLYFITATASM